jgi:hypothetical protein
MVQNVIDKINTNLSAFIKDTYGVVEFIEKNGQQFYATYLNGELSQVYKQDIGNTTSYFYKNGSLKVEEDEDEDSCDKWYKITYPMSLVCYGMRNQFGCDTLSDDAFAESILSCLSVKANELLSISVTSIDTDKRSIFEKNFKGFDYFFRYEQSIVSIELEVVLNVKCLNVINCGN